MPGTADRFTTLTQFWRDSKYASINQELEKLMVVLKMRANAEISEFSNNKYKVGIWYMCRFRSIIEQAKSPLKSNDYGSRAVK